MIKINISKKITTYTLAAALSFSCFAFNPLSNAAIPNAVIMEEQIFGKWGYVIHDKIDGISSSPCAEITNFYETNIAVDSHVTIPDKIDNYPVVSISKTTFNGNSTVNEVNIPTSVKHIDDHFLDGSQIRFILLDESMTFSKEEKNKLTLLSYSGTDTNIEVPDSIGGYIVTNIYNYVFSNNNNIKSIKLPDTINYFGMRVFANSSLEQINIPASLKIIPTGTFSGCTALSNVDFHESIIVDKKQFENNQIVFPEYLRSCEATTGSTSLEPATVNLNQWNFKVTCDSESESYSAEVISYNYLNDTTISDTNKKAEVVIPDSLLEIPVIKIGDNFWSDCNTGGIDLVSITFPTDLEVLRPFSLKNPSALRTVNFKSENIEILSNMFKGTGIEEITLKGSCTIGANAFSSCENLKKILITGDSENIKISNRAFYDCMSLEEIVLPDNSDIDVGSMAFRNCSALKEFTVNGNVSVSSNAFGGCGSLETVRISGNANLLTNAFPDNKALTSIFVDTNNTLDGSAFKGCSNLVNINSITVFDSQNDKLTPELESFVLNNFNGAEDVGFINLYIQSQANKIVSEYTDSSMSDIQKAKILHDWVCNKVSYENEEPNALKNRNDGSIFMNDSTICEGYAKGYNLLLKAAGIESYYVHNSNHAWNIIKLGNHYFHSDTTWDDGDEISHDWFLKSDAEISSETYAHSSWSFITLSPLHNTTNIIPECKYSMGDLNTDGEVSIADMVFLNRYILGSIQLDSDNYILSDLNFDGETDCFDLICMRKMLVNN